MVNLNELADNKEISTAIIKPPETIEFGIIIITNSKRF